MAVTGDRRRRTLFDEDQGCYRTSSGNREKRFGRGCVQTSAAVDGGRSIPPTPLFSGPSNGEREYQRWNAHRRIRSPPPSHRYLRHHSPPSPSSSSSQHPIHIYHHQPSSPSINSSTHSRRPNQSQKHHTRETHKPQFHRFENTHENQFESTKTHSRFSHHNSVTKYKPPNHQFVNHQTKPNTTISLISLTAGHENQFSKTDYHSTEIHFQPQNMASTNSDSKPRPTLPRNRPTTLIDMMHFVSNWFDCEEILMDEITESENFAKIEEDLTKYEVGVSKSEEVVVSKSEFDNEIIEANKNEEDGRLLCDCEEIWVDESDESERISKIESELCKNEIGDDDFCDVLGDRVVDCVDSVQEKVVDCLDVVKNVERIKDIEIKGLKVPVDENVSLENGFDQINTKVEPPVELKPVQAETDSEDKMEPVSSTNDQTTQVQPSEQDVDVAAKDDNSFAGSVEVGRVADVVEHVSSAKVDAGDGDEIQAAELDAESERVFQDALDRVMKRRTTVVVAHRLSTIESSFFEGFVSMSHVLVDQIVGTLCMRFENVKTEGVRRRQWQIAWSFSAFRWMIVLVPLWVWDALRRDFSIGVYHSRKPIWDAVRSTSSFSVCFNRTRGRVLFEEWVTDVGDM